MNADRVQRFAAALRIGAQRIGQAAGRDFVREANEITAALYALDREDDIELEQRNEENVK